ncbi:penicillin acylase family protein [Microbulbifer sp. GL-2]|uniref:penicillin acylase family protein n=1 Tax=Microbulbifer sp. GL-2 TaxID=2591606 RepID=UPI001165B40D|nr:penicillin acylase family protein [Microbulbifer sp. GL-2]BBM03684.1 peptidase [Microbulbifer sp. GL-2]
MARPSYLKSRIVRLLLVFAALSTLAVISIWAWWRLSLPILNGEINTGFLKEPVSIQRDAQGVVMILSKDRNSSAFALGFLHAQERFFQMDLLRRRSAGELSELLGQAVLKNDKKVRRHQFRKRAERNIAAMPQGQRQLLDHYVQGVNFGLAQLGAKPWEYVLLGQEPQPWNAADSLLTTYSMYLTLQSEEGNFERRDTALAELLPEDLYSFFFPAGGLWDAPLIGTSAAEVQIPETPISTLLNSPDPIVYQEMESDDKVYGSNNWVVGGALTEHGGAIVANDMHLRLNVPNIWFRAGWNIPGTNRKIRGVTLPGGPIIVAGSNGAVAWGFTNTGGDWGDLIPLELNENGSKYRTPDGWRDFTIEKETITVNGAEDETIEIRKTIWGPVIGRNHRGIPLAYRWIAHDIPGGNMNLLRIEAATTANQALDLGPEIGIPHQNFVVGDLDGNIGWTVAGAIPRRIGFDGSRSVSWADGEAYWDGYLSAEEQPRIYNPPSHRIWTANARTTSGNWLTLMGDHGYALGARQQQIRDGLLSREHFDEQALLDIQLDDRAVFLQRWQQHLVELLQDQEGYREVYRQVQDWGAHASTDSVGYRIVRNYRLKFMELSTAPILTYMRRYNSGFSFGQLKRQFEYPMWALTQKEPQQLLNPDFESWTALKLTALDQVLDKMASTGKPLQQQTWGIQNTAAIHHPLAKAVPAINWFTAMPSDPLDGDTHMPRFQSPTHGASERMVISPGREAEGIFHMATGQSAHPLSPFFDRGHRDWVKGNPSPMIERETRYQLTLH